MTDQDTRQRGAKRPLRDLTDHELDVLATLGRDANLFREHIRSGLHTLGDLASRELADRELRQAIDASNARLPVA